MPRRSGVLVLITGGTAALAGPLLVVDRGTAVDAGVKRGLDLLYLLLVDPALSDGCPFSGAVFVVEENGLAQAALDGPPVITALALPIDLNARVYPD